MESRMSGVSFKDLEKDIVKYKEEIENARKELGGRLKNCLLEGAKVLVFDKVPYVESIRWTQYTPHFMDGDPCEFGVNELELTVDPGKVGDGSLTEDEVYNTLWRRHDNYPFFDNHWDDDEMYCNFPHLPNSEGTVMLGVEDVPHLDEFDKFFCAVLDDDLFRSALGEGQVVITRDGVEVYDYDHG
jgi:hypothetical protein